MAVAHKLARIGYLMLTRGEEYVDPGREPYEEQQRQRSTAALKRRAAVFGFQIILTAAEAAWTSTPLFVSRKERP